MADEVISTKIVADADFSSLISDVHRVTASLSKLQEQLANSNKMLANNVAVINRNFADTLRSTGQFSSHFVSLTSDVEKFGKNLDGGRLKLRDYFDTYQKHVKTTGGLIRQLAQQQVAMQNAVLQPLGRNAEGLMQFNVHVPRGLDVIKNKTALAKQELMIMNKVIQDGAVQLINWGKNTQWAGRQLTVGLTLPLSAFGKAAADAFRVADQELTRLTKVYGGVAATSTAELKKIRQEVATTAADLAKQYGASFQETIGLAADIAATGKQGNELLASVSETTRLAVLGEVDRQEAMKATLAIQSAFKSNTQELTDSINFLNAVENQTSTTLNDLVEAIPKAGPVIKGLGGSVQDLALYLTAMREGGISASEGANALKSGLASLINPTDKAVGQFKSFGIDLLGIVNNNAGDVTQTLLDLQAALDRLNPLQKQQAIENLFGKFQFSRMNALFENLGKQGSQTLQVLDLMKASTGELANIAGRELTAVTESASGKYRRALESLKADLAGVGEQFLTIGTKLINIVDKALQFFEKLPKPIKSAMVFVGALTAMAGPLIMLTGLLANFFGYILKGVMHMKAFFKGGEGWKYLTPEMMAAEKAGKLIEQTFYSDAKAASVLQVALKNLVDEFAILEAKAKSGSVSVQPAISTMAGNIVMAGGGQRIVNKDHPLVGEYGSRASTHMVPRSMLTEEQKMQQTIFGLVPGSIPVNRKIGQAPQVYMNEQLPSIPGVTTSRGISTGVVAEEAARWHAMMATLGMQSKSEIEQLKKTIATTGVVSKEFMGQFDQILPVVSQITDNAARESALIVADLRAGKITTDLAKQKIIELNLQIERMIAEAVTTQANVMGRTINPTVVPTLNQPVVDASGKSNMRELFKKGKTKDFINKVAGVLGVRTSGAGYNIETTRLKRFADGGTVVPGPRSETTDTQYMELNTGDFVLNRRASDNLLGFNNGGIVPALVTPGEIVIHNPSSEEVPMLEAYNNRFAMGGRVRASKPNYGELTTTQALQMVKKASKFHEDKNYDENMRIATITSDAAILHGMGMDANAAIQMASADYDDAIRYATGKDGTFSLNRFTRRRKELLLQIQRYGSLMGIRDNAVAQETPGGSGATRQPSFNRFDAGIKNIHKLILGSSKFSDKSKKYLSGLGLMSPKGLRSWVRGHFQRYQGLDLQGLEYLYQAAPIPSEINSFWNLTENKRLEQDLLVPVAEGKGGARALLQRTIQNAARRGGYNRNQIPTARDVLSSARGGTPLQKMLREALAMVYSTRNPSLARFAVGGLVGMSKNNYGIKSPKSLVSLGMPRSNKGQKLADEISTRVSSSRFRHVKPIDYGHLIKETEGHSFPVGGVGGIYKDPNGDGFVFVKPMMDEMAALAELRATEIARRAHGLITPRQTIRVMKDPTDTTGKRTFIALQSPYDPAISSADKGFTRGSFFKQLVASLVRGDKDLSQSNVFGPVLADVGTAGVFSRASGQRKFSFNMPSMADQATINLLGVKGGARKAFAESTVNIAKRMTPDAYHDAIIKEINTVLPKLREVVSSFKLTRMERKMYERMIRRLEDGLKTDWRPFHAMHTKVKPQKLALGGVVGRNKSNYGRVNNKAAAAAAAAEAANKGMATSFAGMGLMAGASMVGGQAGQIMNFAGMAMQIMPLLSFLPKLPPALTQTLGPFAKMAGAISKVSGGLTGLTKVFNLVLKPLSLILRAVNPVTAGLTLLAIGLKFYIDKQKELAESNRISRLGFGMTAESAKKAGYEYQDYNKKTKDAIGNLKAIAERNKMISESMTQAGVPFKMTIEQYKKLKETVKETMGDYVKLFDATKVKDVGKVAVQLKAQFMASGDSAEEATSKIYTLLSLSNKTSMAGSTIGLSIFKNVKGLQDAAEATVKTFDAATKSSDAKGQVDALLSAFTALDAATNKIVSDSIKANKKTGSEIVSEYDAASQVVEKINNKFNTQKNLTSEMIRELSKTNPELSKILTTSDTITTAFQKLKILSSGININVASLNQSATRAASQIITAVQSAVKNNPIIKTQTGAYKALQDQIKAAEKAQKGLGAKQQIDSRKTIEGLQKQIDLIKKAAQDKIDAIRKQTEAQNAELEIQKEQLQAQQALVSGDMSAYAESQLNIKQIINTQQQKAAEETITKKAELDIKPLQDQIDKLNKKNQEFADASALAGERLTSLNKKAGIFNDSLTTYTTNLDNLAFKVKTLGESFKGSDEYKEAMSALKIAGDKLGIKADPEKVLNDIVKGLGNISTDLVNVYLAGGGKAASFGQGGTSANPRDLGASPTDLRSWSNPLSKGPTSAREVIKEQAKTYGVSPGEFFTVKDYKGKEYKFKMREDGNITMVSDPYEVKRAMGGRVVPGIAYALHDGGKVEGIKFDRPGMVYPNINTMAKYDLPASVSNSVPKGVNNSYNNNVYNIDIALNGTNVTADDVIRKFKAELALVNAREGNKTRVVGGYN